MGTGLIMYTAGGDNKLLCHRSELRQKDCVIPSQCPHNHSLSTYSGMDNSRSSLIIYSTVTIALFFSFPFIRHDTGEARGSVHAISCPFPSQ